MSVNDEKKACRLGGGTLPSIYLCRITRREKVLVNRVRGYAWWCTGGEWRGFGSGGLDPIDHEASYTARPLQTLLAGATYFCSFKTEQKGEESSCSRTIPLPITLFSPIFVSRLVTLLPRAVHLSLSLSLSLFLPSLSLSRSSIVNRDFQLWNSSRRKSNDRREWIPLLFRKYAFTCFEKRIKDKERNGVK